MTINKDNLSTQIYRLLKERITDLEIEPGQRIDVDGLEEEFGVSRAPIREALKELSEKGLVEIRPRVGYFAVKLDLERAKDVCDMRSLFECYALEEAVENISEEELKELRETTVGLMEKELDAEELREKFDRTDDWLHRQLILKNAGNELLHDFSDRIHNLVALTRHLNERIGQALEEHLEIIDSLLKGDKEGAREALEEHLANVKEEILVSLREEEESLTH